MEQFSYWLWENAIPKEICNHIIQNAKWSAKKNGSILSDNGYIRDQNIRKTEIVFENPLSLSECILRSYITAANKSANWNYLLTDVQNVQIGRYVDGGHYSYHKDDVLPNRNKIVRKLSAVLFLSDPNDYDGGLFEIEELENEMDKFTKGSIIVFPSYIKHRVTPVTKGVRYTAVCWALGPAFK
jgi:PKHD-type hydroxylase